MRKLCRQIRNKFSHSKYVARVITNESVLESLINGSSSRLISVIYYRPRVSLFRRIQLR